MHPSLSRRGLLAAGGVALCGLTTDLARTQEVSSSPEAFPASAEAALTRLMDGNRRFLTGRSTHPHAETRWRRGLEETQKPFATILSCSDSRVPPELLFDQGFGDLFVIRVAGHVVDPSTLGSLQYALVHLKTPLFLVLGHEHCGAVTAAVQALQGEHDEPRDIEDLVKMIEPGLDAIDLGANREQVIHDAVLANVHWTIKQLAEVFEGREAAEYSRVVGAVYELNRGEVRILG
jgi:carbonic anhydrase